MEHRIEIAPRTIFLVLGVVAAIWVLGQLSTVVSVVVIALVLVGTFEPLVSWLERRGLRRHWSLVIVFFLAATVLAGVMLLMVPPLLAQTVHLIEDAPQGRTRLVQWLANYHWAKPLIGAINDLPLEHAAANAGKVMIGYSTKLFAAIGYGISALFLALYLLADPKSAKGMLYAVVPRHHHVKLASILLELKLIVGGYIRGQLITSLAISVFVFGLLLVLNVDNALAIALFAGLTDIIPFVGGYVASTPVIIAATPHGSATTIVVLCLMVLYQEFESRILVPRVYGRVLRLPPAIVIVSLLIGGTLGGILGALLALPIAAAVRMLIRELHVDLPGANPTPETVLDHEEKLSEHYENVAEGQPPAEAGTIATGIATKLKHATGQ